MRVFIIESPNPKDILEERSESKPLEYICKAMGHKVYSFLVKSERDFKETCSFISSMYEGENQSPDEPLCIHISAHGNEAELVFGVDHITWDEVAKSLEPILKMGYEEDIFLIVSACGTDKQKITNEIQKMQGNSDQISPPKYVIAFDQETVNWDDAILTWTILYHQIHKIDHNDKKNVKGLLDRIQGSQFGNLAYRRWNKESKKYIRYIPKIKD